MQAGTFKFHHCYKINVKETLKNVDKYTVQTTIAFNTWADDFACCVFWNKITHAIHETQCFLYNPSLASFVKVNHPIYFKPSTFAIHTIGNITTVLLKYNVTDINQIISFYKLVDNDTGAIFQYSSPSQLAKELYPGNHGYPGEVGLTKPLNWVWLGINAKPRLLLKRGYDGPEGGIIKKRNLKNLKLINPSIIDLYRGLVGHAGLDGFVMTKNHQYLHVVRNMDLDLFRGRDGYEGGLGLEKKPNIDDNFNLSLVLPTLYRGDTHDEGDEGFLSSDNFIYLKLLHKHSFTWKDDNLNYLKLYENL